jgi:hypothetical protein
MPRLAVFVRQLADEHRGLRDLGLVDGERVGGGLARDNLDLEVR